MFAGLIPATSDAAIQSINALWDLVNPGIPHTQRGTTLDQEYACIQARGSWNGKQSTINAINRNNLADSINSGLFVVVAVRLNDLLNYLGPSNHFLLCPPYSLDSAGFIHVMDSCYHADMSIFYHPDESYSAGSIIKAGEDIFGADQQIGWAFNWN